MIRRYIALETNGPNPLYTHLSALVAFSRNRSKTSEYIRRTEAYVSYVTHGSWQRKQVYGYTEKQ